MTDCLFCKIVAGEVPADIVAQTEETVAFRDIAPQAPTHVLVVPRAHHEDVGALASAEPALLGRLFAAAADVARIEGLDGGYRLLTNTGRDAGQTVSHVHVHVLGGRPLGALA
ncbi:MAG: hypothetical protein AVDCRST_MAG07-3354 [uncultured Frankineae bacterium]|uniref:HIT domain-containing protein n=1 Tax=uncultured Frankineae bacterium TaxID=437475 RepID=A0A6J4MBL2_9ACTN|nr:MAG: hypothetical protein AVDCRST_MAG07-3354 [uncultured Frankineae bacterium]